MTYWLGLTLFILSLIVGVTGILIKKPLVEALGYVLQIVGWVIWLIDLLFFEHNQILWAVILAVIVQVLAILYNVNRLSKLIKKGDTDVR